MKERQKNATTRLRRTHQARTAPTNGHGGRARSDSASPRTPPLRGPPPRLLLLRRGHRRPIGERAAPEHAPISQRLGGGANGAGGTRSSGARHRSVGGLFFISLFFFFQRLFLLLTLQMMMMTDGRIKLGKPPNKSLADGAGKEQKGSAIVFRRFEKLVDFT